jgi:hypothetical protein
VVPWPGGGAHCQHVEPRSSGESACPPIRVRNCLRSALALAALEPQTPSVPTGA